MADAEQDEFADFVTASSPKLLWAARMLCGGDRGAAEDLVQEALVETFRRWGRIDEPAARYAYARRILVRRATRRWRAQPRAIEVVTDAVPTYGSTGGTAEVDAGIDLWSALAQLSSRQRAVLVLRYYEDLTEQQIASVLGCSTGTVKTHASRALATLSVRLSAANDRTGEEIR